MGRGRLARRIGAVLIGMASACFAAPAAGADEVDDTDTAAAEADPTAADRSGGFGGPSSVGGQIEEDAQPSGPRPRICAFDGVLRGYYDWKSYLDSCKGLQIAADYTFLHQRVTDSLGDEEATAGMFRFYGTWTALGRGHPNSGALVFKVENRHTFTDTAPLNLGFAAGQSSVTGPPFSDAGWILTNLYWRQRFCGGKGAFVVGVVDVTDYLDLYGLINPWTAFQNLNFLTNPTIASPNQGLGAAVAVRPDPNTYVIAGVADANADPADANADVFDDGELFSHFEWGWNSAPERFIFDNVHLTLWHADRREAAGVPQSYGAAFSAAKFVGDCYMPFFRAGWSTGGASLLRAHAAVGIGRYFYRHGDLAAIGLSWGRPFGDDVNDEYVSEIFYRFQVTKELAITPSLQLLVNPTNNPDEDVVGLFGLRIRLAL
ncbi:MAG: carbohydrate porin [Planctomycetota bacterium]|nr:carbohydrate porin [Planctomycetota bacterium]